VFSFVLFITFNSKSIFPWSKLTLLSSNGAQINMVKVVETNKMARKVNEILEYSVGSRVYKSVVV